MDEQTDQSTNQSPKKRVKWSQRYLASYALELPGIQVSTISKEHAFCSICSVDFSVAHGGRNDVSKHVKGKKHEERVLASKNSYTMKQFLNKTD
jgi:hypothetical protein